MDIAVLIVALVYAAAFFAISWRYPPLTLALIFAPAPFQNDLSQGLGGIKFSFSEINLVLALPLFAAMLLVGARRLRSWPMVWVCIVYLFACIASAFAHWRGSTAISSFIQMFLFLFVVVPIFSRLPRRPEDLKLALWGMLGVSALLSLTKMLHPSQEAFGINKNGMGGSMACALIITIELWFHYREYPTRHKHVLVALMGIISIGLLLTLSRGGWLAAMSGILLVTILRRQVALLLRAAIVIIPLIAIVWNMLPQESRSYATSFSSERGNIKQRYINSDNAIKSWQQNIWFGDGLGLRKETDATNFIIFALAETGIFGLITFVAMFVVYFNMLWNARGRLPRNDFRFSLVAIGGGLMLSRLSQGMVDHYWARGPTMMAWASSGMVLCALWYVPEGARDQLQRARALLSLHLLESLRRTRSGDQSLPRLTQGELLAAQNALKIVEQNRTAPPVAVRSHRHGENDALSELTRRLRTSGRTG